MTAANLRFAGQPQLAERILIVDDDESMRRMIAEVLSAAGYAVSEASTGREALRYSLKKRFNSFDGTGDAGNRRPSTYPANA